MLDEIKKIVKFVAKEPKYSAIWKKILAILAVFALLLLFDRFLLVNLADRGGFFISLFRTKETFWGKAGVYSAPIVPTASELKLLGLSQVTAEVFNLPLFALILYFPFAFIKDFNWALALWLAANQVSCYFILNVSLKIMGRKLSERYQIVAAGILMIVYFVIVNILQTNLALIQVLLILWAYLKIRQKEYIFAGLLLGLAFFNPFEMFLPLIILIALNIANSRNVVNGWLLISFILLSLAFVIFDMRWVLEWIKILILKPSIYPFISYRQYLNEIFPTVNTGLAELIPITIYMWLIIEWLRTPKENYLQELWLLSLGFTLAPLLNMWGSPYSLVGNVFVLVYTISLWYERAPRKFKQFSAGIYSILLIILPAIQMIVNHRLLTTPETYFYNLIFMLILLFNLYWVRLWVVNPYYSVNKLDEI